MSKYAIVERECSTGCLIRVLVTFSVCNDDDVVESWVENPMVCDNAAQDGHRIQIESWVEPVHGHLTNRIRVCKFS